MIVHTNFFYDHWRRLFVELRVVWIDHGNTFDRRKPQLAISASPPGRVATATTLARQHSVRSTKRSRRHGLAPAICKFAQFVERDFENALGRGAPKIALVIFQNAIDD